MSEEQRIAYLNAMVATAMIEAIGMQAENMQRKVVGSSMAYTMDDFVKITERMGIHHNGALNVLQGGKVG